jgi:hypothetical protein
LIEDVPAVCLVAVGQAISRGVYPPFFELKLPLCRNVYSVYGKGRVTPYTLHEHVFPAALGGNLVVKDGTCDKCNHGNSKFEQALAIELTPIRMLLQIPDRYGKVPHTAATLVTPEKTYDGRVKGDGSVVVKPVITQEKNEKGEREFVHRFLTDAQKEKLREQARKKGQQLIEAGPKDPVTAEVHIGGDLMVIGSPEGLRTVAKIAYVGLAHLVGVKVAVGDAFKEVRQLILEGKPEGVTRFFTHKRYRRSSPRTRTATRGINIKDCWFTICAAALCATCDGLA